VCSVLKLVRAEGYRPDLPWFPRRDTTCGLVSQLNPGFESCTVILPEEISDNATAQYQERYYVGLAPVVSPGAEKTDLKVFRDKCSF